MQVVVEARELRSMFRSLRPILRNSMDGGLLGFAVEDNILTVTCKNGIIFEQKFAVEPEGPMYATVVFRDIAELLPGQGQVEIDISEKAVSIQAEEFGTTFLAAYGEVTKYVPRVKEYKPCRGEDYRRMANTFQQLSSVSKSLKKESSVLLVPPRAICKYPTVWLEVIFRGLSTTIGLREIRTIANFDPKYYGVSGDAVEFINGSAMMAFPITPVGEVRTCKEVLSNPSEAYRLSSTPESLESLQSFARTVHGSCKLSFYSDGYSVQYKNQEVEMALRMGACVGKCYYTLDTYTEYLLMFFKLIEGKTAFLYKADNAIMIEVPNELRLLHSIV